MTSHKHTFRPGAGEALEDRTVPSGGLNGFLGGLIGSAPAQDARLVQQAFSAFQRSYNTDVNTILFQTGTGLTPATQRSAFDAQVAIDLKTLTRAVDAAIANLPNATALTATVNGQILGTGTSGLQGALAGVATPTASGRFSSFVFQGQARRDIFQTANQVSQEVRTAPAPAGTIDATTLGGVLDNINTAYRTFRTSYNNDVNTILYQSGTGVTPATQRSAFDAQVGKDVQTLQASVTAALSPLPASVSSSLTTTLTNDLLSNGGTGRSLQDNLKSLRTPGSGFFSTLFFRIGSTATLGASQARVVSDVVSAVRTFNASAAGTATTV